MLISSCWNAHILWHYFCVRKSLLWVNIQEGDPCQGIGRNFWVLGQWGGCYVTPPSPPSSSRRRRLSQRRREKERRIRGRVRFHVTCLLPSLSGTQLQTLLSESRDAGQSEQMKLSWAETEPSPALLPACGCTQPDCHHAMSNSLV